MSEPSYINIIATNAIFDASNAPLTKGTIAFELATRLQLPSANAQIIRSPITRPIANGSMTGPLTLANTSSSSPADVGYTITITDSLSGKREVYDNVAIDPDESGNWDLASLQAGIYTTGVPVTRVVGPAGASAYELAVDAGFTGTEQDFSFGITALINLFLNGSLPRFQWILADTNGVKYALSITAGAEQTNLYIGLAAAAPLYLTDIMSSDVWSLTVVAGAQTLLPAPAGAVGLPLVLFLDPITGLQYRLSVVAGALTVTPA